MSERLLSKDEKRRAWILLKRLFFHHQNLIFFSAGFLFDAFTLDRIDAWLDLSIQGLYLLALTILLVLQQREAAGLWKPAGRIARVWEFNLEALHFLFGGLLSAYVIFYTRSGVNVRTFLFFGAAIALLVYNELPEARRWGMRLRMALYTFCIASFLIYFVPVLVGKMGDGIFGLSILAAAVWSGGLVTLLAFWEEEAVPAAVRLATPVAITLLALAGFYYLRWIPPVPLEMKFVGIYHKVQRKEGVYELTFLKGPWYSFLKTQDRPYLARKGDKLYCFVRIFAPTRFTHEVTLHWRKLVKGRWVTRDRVPLKIKGGRAEGYRGFAYKRKFEAGEWKILVETEDRRVLGKLTFKVRADDSKAKRRWKTVRM